MSYASEYYGGGGVVTGAATQVVGGAIYARIGELKIVEIPCNQTVEDIPLTFVVETKQKVDVAELSSGSISTSGTTATLTLTAPMTQTERTLHWSLTITATGETVASGLLFCTYDAQGD